MKKDWKINIGGCVCFLGKREDESMSVFFAPPDRKTISKTVVKLVESVSLKNFIELWIDDYDQFKLKVGNDLELLCKHHSFPDPEAWYPVRNWMIELSSRAQTSQMAEYLKFGSLKEGEFEGNWTPLFASEYEKSVNFISENMPEWEEKQEEIIRRMSFELGKKTTKWIPGHKYDSETNSYWYIGEVYTRIGDRTKNKETHYFGDQVDLIKNVGKQMCYLMKAPADPTNFWNNVVFSFDQTRKDLNYLDILLKKPKVVDSGEWFPSSVNPWEDPMKWRKEMIIRTLENVCKKVEILDGIETTSYYFLNLAFEPIFMYLGDKDEPDMKKIGEEVKPILLPVIYNCLEHIVAGDIEDILSPDRDKDRNIDYITNQFIGCYIRENFYHKKTLVKKLFESLGMPLENIVEDFLDNFSIKDRLESGWDKYIENFIFLRENPTYANRYFDIRKKATQEFLVGRGIQENRVECIVDKSLGDGNITQDTKDLLVDMIKWSKNNNTLGLTKFWETKSNQIEIIITLKDIINRFKSEGTEIPDNYKTGIVSDKIWRVTILADSNTNWDNQ